VIIYIYLLAIPFSCQNKTENAKEIVNQFLTEINNDNMNITKENLTVEYRKHFKENHYYPSSNWELKTKSENVITVEAKSQSSNVFGISELIQTFYLKMENGRLKIYDSNNLVTNNLDFEVIDLDWNYHTDMERNKIYKNIKDNMSIKVLEEAHKGFINGNRRGIIKIINNSNYDVKGVRVLIEHFDNNWKSVNTDYSYVSDIIRKKGYREQTWLTSDCFNCENEKFKINFIKED
jgi:hypothetical protein